MGSFAIEQFGECKACGRTPSVSREKEERQFHLQPCCDVSLQMIFERRPRAFYFEPGRPSSQYIQPFERRSEAVEFWNQLMKAR